MSKFQIFRETALPGTLQPYALYIVAPTSKPNYIELYATNSTGTQAKRIIQDTDVQALIDASIAGLSSIEIVADIPARDALNQMHKPIPNCFLKLNRNHKRNNPQISNIQQTLS